MGSQYAVTTDDFNIRDAPSIAVDKSAYVRLSFVAALPADRLSHPAEGHAA